MTLAGRDAARGLDPVDRLLPAETAFALVIGPIIAPAGRRRDEFAPQPDVARQDACKKPLIHMIGFQIAVCVDYADDTADGLGDGPVYHKVVLCAVARFASAIPAAQYVLRTPPAASNRDGGLQNDRVRQVSLVVFLVISAATTPAAAPAATLAATPAATPVSPTILLAGRGRIGMIGPADGSEVITGDAGRSVRQAQARIDHLDDSLGQQAQGVRIIHGGLPSASCGAVHIDRVGHPDIAGCSHRDRALDHLVVVVVAGVAADDNVSIDEDLSARLRIDTAERLRDIRVLERPRQIAGPWRLHRQGQRGTHRCSIARNAVRPFRV